MMKFYLMRHGQTDRNLENRLQGSKNVPMNSDEDFSERNFGLAEGLIWNQEINLDDEKYAAESVEDTCKRAKVAVDKYMSYDDISVLIVAHGAILSAVKHVLSQGTLGYYDSSVPIIQGNILCCEIYQSGRPSFYYLL